MMKAATLESIVSIEPFEPPSLVTELGDLGSLNQQEKPRLVCERDLLLSSWLQRELPPRDYLLGNIMCTTSRWLIWGETGVGKTLFALDLAAAVASGKSFLGWEARGRPARVSYFDGELPAETFKERMHFMASRYGEELNLYGYNRDVLPDGQMPPFNTPEGEAWLWREIDAVRPDLVVFDSVMCLTTGAMSEEESWTPIKLPMRKLSRRRIAQVWLHHTGHDTKGFRDQDARMGNGHGGQSHERGRDWRNSCA
jgi:RecA-family ATPase